MCASCDEVDKTDLFVKRVWMDGYGAGRVDSLRDLLTIFNETITANGDGPMTPEAIFRVLTVTLLNTLETNLIPDSDENLRGMEIDFSSLVAMYPEGRL